MHQGHNIPWNIISTNYRFVQDDKGYTPPFTGLVSKKRPSAPNELKHFVNKFTNAISIFSETERKKYPQNFTPMSTGNLFSDELRDKYPEYLNARNQDVKYWVERARETNYTTMDGDLADVIKVLLYENEMETLLMLAHHPSIPIAKLHSLSWGHHFGFNRVKESALRAYMFFNTAEATGILENGQYALMQDQYSSLLNEIAAGMDFPAQQIPHRRFLQDCGVIPEIYRTRWEDSKTLVHKDYNRLQEYLKTLFALMYRYDVLVRECRLDPEWEVEIAHQWPLKEHVNMEWDERDKKCQPEIVNSAHRKMGRNHTEIARSGQQSDARLLAREQETKLIPETLKIDVAGYNIAQDIPHMGSKYLFRGNLSE